MRITFVIYSLECGGAERNAAQMARYWVGCGHDVSVVTLAGSGASDFYDLPEGVDIVRLSAAGRSGGFWDKISRNLGRVRRLRQAIRSLQPDIVISFMETTNVLVLLATAGTGIDVIVSDRNDPVREYYGPIWRILRNLTYPWAARLVVQTRTVLKRYPRYLTGKATAIPNPITDFRYCENTTFSAGDKDRKQICAMGRLVRQKGFDLLLDAFGGLAAEFPDWNIVVWGEGSERAALENQRDRMGLTNRVIFKGHTQHPDKAFIEADIFVLPSRWEGFPNVLMEAMASGLPVIAVDCPVGPAEIITHNEDGLLVPCADIPALRNSLRCLMTDEILCQRLGGEAKRVAETYALGRIMKEWDRLVLTDESSENAVQRAA